MTLDQIKLLTPSSKAVLSTVDGVRQQVKIVSADNDTVVFEHFELGQRNELIRCTGVVRTEDIISYMIFEG